ncbi:MAG: AAA family ATPase, partial [Desulfobacterales bacterium]|nr:AAA family ATPase [Desulfobacterales bacterium]
SNYFGKQIFSITMNDSIRYNCDFEDILDGLLMEANLQNGIVFFDECDDMFQDHSRESRSLLVKIEKAKCVIILATNKPVKLDPAMDRRINMKVKFKLPDEKLRYQIWKTLIPETVDVSNDVNLNYFAKKYCFNGGFIKNSVLMAVNNAIGNMNKDTQEKRPLITHELLFKSSEIQSIKIFNEANICKTYIPDISIDKLSISKGQKDKLSRISKVYETLYEQKLGLNLIISSSNIDTGVNVADAIAKECKMKVKKFNFYEVVESTSNEKVTNPVTQEEVTLLEYAFSPTNGDDSLILFADYEGKSSIVSTDVSNLKNPKISNNKKIDLKPNLLKKLREHNGIFCLVVYNNDFSLPAEFNFHICVDYPSKEVQLNRWKHYISDNMYDEKQLFDIVENFPKHISEIDFIARRATINSIIDGNKNLTLNYIITEIERDIHKEKIPVLFGEHVDFN